MDSNRANWLYALHANALAYVDVEAPDGRRSIGSGFHIGEGIFVTAQHVLKGRRIVQVRVTEPVGIRAAELFPDLTETLIADWDNVVEEVIGSTPLYKHWTPPLAIADGPVFHENPEVDVAVFRARDVHPAVGVVLLGAHLDDWVYRGNWHLSEALVLGYPPIPMTLQPHLVAVRAQINTYVIPRISRQVHFILSAVPRGGFSGGPALHEDGYALGLVTSSLLEVDKPVETGFMAVLSIEPILSLLSSAGMMPRCQASFQDEFLDGLNKGQRAEELVRNFRRRLRQNSSTA